MSKEDHITSVLYLFTTLIHFEAKLMTIRRSIALLLSAAVVIAAAACSSPTAPKGCDIVTSGSSTC